MCKQTNKEIKNWYISLTALCTQKAIFDLHLGNYYVVDFPGGIIIMY